MPKKMEEVEKGYLQLFPFNLLYISISIMVDKDSYQRSNTTTSGRSQYINSPLQTFLDLKIASWH